MLLETATKEGDAFWYDIPTYCRSSAQKIWNISMLVPSHRAAPSQVYLNKLSPYADSLWCLVSHTFALSTFSVAMNVSFTEPLFVTM